MKKRFKVFDNEGKTWDRYTVVGRKLSDGWYDALYLSENCNQANGVSIYSEVRLSAMSPTDKRIKFSDLPKHVQEHVLTDNRI